MTTKRLSANGVFQTKKKITKSSFLEQCIKKLYCGESTIKRFWDAKEKVSANIYEDCCAIAKVDPNLNEDRSPLSSVISQTALKAALHRHHKRVIKSSLYNDITIFNLQLNLEPNIIVVTGQWRAELRDDYHEMLEQFKVIFNLLMTLLGVKVVTIEDKQLFEVAASGDFCLKYLLIWEDYKINVYPFEVSITANNEVHKMVFENLTKYQERVSKPIKESQIFSQEILQEIFEKEVTHKFFKVTGFSVKNNLMILEIDESYPENKALVETELKRANEGPRIR